LAEEGRPILSPSEIVEAFYNDCKTFNAYFGEEKPLSFVAILEDKIEEAVQIVTNNRYHYLQQNPLNVTT